jgi:hypothetical protein
MNRIKDKKFYDALVPIIDKCCEWWFPVSPTSGMCGFCSNNCSQDDKHDDDCLLQLAKNVKDGWDEIDENPKWKFDYCEIKQDWTKPRSRSSTEMFREAAKRRKFFEVFGSQIRMLSPLDFADPGNAITVCYCVLATDDWNSKQHQPDCVKVAFGKALSDWFAP